MRPDLQKLFHNADTMDRVELVCSFRGLIQDYSELVSLMEENKKAETEMAIQFQQMKDLASGALRETEILKKENLRLTQQLNLRKKELFGKSSEQTSDVIGNSVCDDGNEDPISEDQPDCADNNSTDNPVEDPAVTVLDATSRKKCAPRKTKRTRSRIDVSGLPVKTEFDFDVGKLNEIYGEFNWSIYGWELYEEIIHVPSNVYRKLTYAPILSLKEEQTIVREPYDGKLLYGSLASPSLVADIMYQKTVMGTPLYRLEQDFLRNGFILPRQVMTTWFNRFAVERFSSVYEYLIALQLADGYTQADETYWQVIINGKDSSSKDYFWVHTTSELSDNPSIIIFCYEPTRSTKHLRDYYLANLYEGYVTSDAYVSYGLLEEESGGTIISTGCFMHSRRRIVYAFLSLNLNGMSMDAIKELPEYKALELVDAIYEVETPLKSLDEAERLEKRNSDVRPRVNAFFEYLRSLDGDDPALSERMRDAISYSLNNEERLCRFLDDAKIPMDNGFCERSIRSLAITRNNSLFSFSAKGAKALGIVFTMTETAKANCANPYYYLKYLLEKVPPDTSMVTPKILRDLVPWSETYRAYEESEKKEALRYHADQSPPVFPKTPRKKDAWVIKPTG